MNEVNLMMSHNKNQSGGTSPQGETKMRMLAVGDTFPDFSMTATVSTNLGKAFRTITDRDYPGKWKCAGRRPAAGRGDHHQIDFVHLLSPFDLDELVREARLRQS